MSLSLGLLRDRRPVGQHPKSHHQHGSDKQGDYEDRQPLTQ